MMRSVMATAISTALASNLPEATVSKVCPAVGFDHDHEATDAGEFKISFLPFNPSLPFDFVDVHVVMEDLEGQIIGNQRNYRMSADRGGMWSASLEDPQHIAALEQRRDDINFKYSFSYCVGINGKPVDCDTDAFDLVEFSNRAGLVECPDDCGLPASFLPVPVTCVGSNGREYGDERCRDLPRPQPVSCPATVPCIEYFWEPLPVTCPKSCGLDSSMILPEVMCMGSDGNMHADALCAGLQRPPRVYCPATESCVTFERRAGLVECPTECGLPESYLPVETECVGSDGRIYPQQDCADLASPAPIYCSATEPCVEYFWEPLPVSCPSTCGLGSSLVLPEVICMGTDDNQHNAAMCAGLPRPSEVACPATEPCVEYFWEPLPVSCPSTCGLGSSLVLPEVICMGTDDNQHNAAMCAGLPRPSEVACPATEPCVTYSWRAGLSEPCPTECGLPASTANVPASCYGSDGSLAPGELCDPRELPQSLKCAGTEPCALEPLPRTCPALDFTHNVNNANGAIVLTFRPVGKDIKRRRLDWVDVHYQVVDANNRPIPGSTLVNKRLELDRTFDAPDSLQYKLVVDSPLVSSYGYRGYKLKYSFTYCIEMIDCDTKEFIFPSSPLD